jgi:hypothetical protein
MQSHGVISRGRPVGGWSAPFLRYTMTANHVLVLARSHWERLNNALTLCIENADEDGIKAAREKLAEFEIVIRWVADVVNGED